MKKKLLLLVSLISLTSVNYSSDNLNENEELSLSSNLKSCDDYRKKNITEKDWDQVKSIVDESIGGITNAKVSYREVMYGISPLIISSMKKYKKNCFDNLIKDIVFYINEDHYLGGETKSGYISSYFKKLGRGAVNLISSKNHDRTDIAIIRILLMFAENVELKFDNDLIENDRIENVIDNIEKEEKLSNANIQLRYSEFIYTFSAAYNIMYKGKSSISIDERISLLTNYFGEGEGRSKDFYKNIFEKEIVENQDQTVIKGFVLNSNDSNNQGKFIFNDILKSKDDVLNFILLEDSEIKNYKDIIDFASSKDFYKKINDSLEYVYSQYEIISKEVEEQSKLNKDDLNKILKWNNDSGEVLKVFAEKAKKTEKHDLITYLKRTRYKSGKILKDINKYDIFSTKKPNLSLSEDIKKDINDILEKYNKTKSNIENKNDELLDSTDTLLNEILLKSTNSDSNDNLLNNLVEKTAYYIKDVIHNKLFGDVKKLYMDIAYKKASLYVLSLVKEDVESKEKN